MRESGNGFRSPRSVPEFSELTGHSAMFLGIGWFTCAFAFWIAWRRRQMSGPADQPSWSWHGIPACAARGSTVWQAAPPSCQMAILATPIPLFFGPLLLLFITQFPRRGRRAWLY